MRKGVSKTVENKLKEQNVGFLGMIAATLDTMLSRNMLASKGVIRVGDRVIWGDEGDLATSWWWYVIRAGEGTISGGQSFQCRLII